MAQNALNTLSGWLSSGADIYNTAQPLLNLGGAIYGRNQASDAVSDATRNYQNYAEKGMNILGDVYQESKAAGQPFLTAGTDAVQGYSNLLANPNQVTQTPGYAFRMDQGEEALRRTQAAAGYRGSGAQQAALLQYGQDYATSEFDKALNRYLPMVNTGLSAYGTLSNLGENYSRGMAGIYEGVGNALASAEGNQSAITDKFLGDLLGGFGDVGSGSGGNTLGDALSSGASLTGKVGDALASGSNLAGKVGSFVNSLGSSGATGAGLAGSVFAPAAATGATTLGTAGLVGGSSTAAGVAGLPGAGLASTPNLLGSLTSGANAAGAGAGLGAGLFGAGVLGLIGASALGTKNRDEWPKIVAAAKQDPSGFINEIQQSIKTPVAFGANAVPGKVATLLGAAKSGAFSSDDIPQEVFDSSALETSMRKVLTNVENSLPGIEKTHTDLNLFDASLAGLSYPDVLMEIFNRTSNPKIKQYSLQLLGA